MLAMTSLWGVVAVGFLCVIFQRSHAVSNCWLCDYNNGDCHNANTWTVVTCNDGLYGNDTPCWKSSVTGSRGCAMSLAACTTSAGLKDTDFNWQRPWRWVWNQVYPTVHDCFGQHGCHEFYCCRDEDRCNAAEAGLTGRKVNFEVVSSLAFLYLNRN